MYYYLYYIISCRTIGLNIVHNYSTNQIFLYLYCYDPAYVLRYRYLCSPMETRRGGTSVALKIYHSNVAGLHQNIRANEYQDPIGEIQRSHEVAKTEDALVKLKHVAKNQELLGVLWLIHPMKICKL